MTDSLLVSTQWLQQHLHDAALRVVDIRGHVIPASEPLPHYFNHRADYDQSHIPGAVFIDWVKEITDPDDPRHAQIAKLDRYAEVMRRIGIGPDTFVVAYDDASGMFAARLWWSLNYYGHARVAVLDGGWQKWVAEGHPTTVRVPSITPSMFEAKPNLSLRRTADDVLRDLNTEACLIDVRTTEEFEGKSSRAKRKGHIPGAINLPRSVLLAHDGTLLPPEQLRLKLVSAGVDPDAPEIVTYCNGGVSASYAMLALRVAGLNNVAMYDGSWKDWGNDDSKPIET